MRSIFQILLLLTISHSVHSVVVGRNDIVIQNLTLFVEGQEYWIKGIAYEPVPLGYIDSTGLCSLRETPFGDIANPVPEFKSACYDSDYYDGAIVEGGPPDGWFKGIWDRDFPKLDELGVNTLRPYNINPTTLQASIEQVGTGNIIAPLGKNHIPFMDMAEEHNFKIVFPLIGDYTLMMNTDGETYRQYLRNQIDEVGNHSSLLMYTVGNELGLITGDEIANWTASEGIPGHVVQLLNEYMGFARQYQIDTWGRFIPVTTAVVDYPDSYLPLVQTLDVDIFTTNAGYRGDGFTNLWDGTGPQFPGWRTLSCTFGKPVFIGEWGWESINNAQNYLQPDWFNKKYADLVRHNNDGCIGGIFFEYNDEPYKASAAQQTMGVVRFNETACSHTVDCFDPDPVEEKEIIFNAMKQGMYDETDDGVANARPWNYNTDVFELLRRPPRSLDGEMFDICEGVPTYTYIDPTYPTFSTIPTGLPPNTDSSQTDSPTVDKDPQTDTEDSHSVTTEPSKDPSASGSSTPLPTGSETRTVDLPDFSTGSIQRVTLALFIIALSLALFMA